MGLFLYNNEISLPSGYTLLDEQSLKRNIPKNIRLLHEEIYYLFNPSDPEYLVYLNTCREDTKNLAKALKKELRERKIVVSNMIAGPSKAQHTDLEINLLIRPPLLRSFLADEEKAVTRMKANDHVDNFVLHIDPQRRLQFIRSWCPQTQDATKAECIFKRRIMLSATMHLLRSRIHVYTFASV